MKVKFTEFKEWERCQTHVISLFYKYLTGETIKYELDYYRSSRQHRKVYKKITKHKTFPIQLLFIFFPSLGILLLNLNISHGIPWGVIGNIGYKFRKFYVQSTGIKLDNTKGKYGNK